MMIMNMRRVLSGFYRMNLKMKNTTSKIIKGASILLSIYDAARMVAMRILLTIYSPPRGLNAQRMSEYIVIRTIKTIETDSLDLLKLGLRRSESPI
mgnify:CR=1 FL=1